MRRIMAAFVVPVAVVAALSGTAWAARQLEAVVKPRDLTVLAPQTLDLSAPPYQSVLGSVTYGYRVTLLEVKDHATAVNPEVSNKPIKPGRGFRWVGVRVRVVNTGSQDGTRLIPKVIGSNGKSDAGSDATMPGCAQLAVFPPPTLPAGHGVTACDTYLVPDKVTVRAVTVNMGFANPAATGLWQILPGSLAKPKFPLVYAALGDSYSSGEGSGDYEDRLPKCHRGADAWPRLVAQQNHRLVRMRLDALVACSGADSDALRGQVEGQPNQILTLRELKPRPGLVTVTIGGNDVKFVPILTDCVLFDCATDGRLARAEKDVEHEYSTLVTDYRKIRAADRSATIIVVGYPRLFPERQRDVTATCLWLTDDELPGLNQLDADLDAVIHSAAVAAGLRFADVSNALNGHEGCTQNSWLYHFLPSGQQSGHPTKPGQRAIAAIVQTYIRHQL